MKIYNYHAQTGEYVSASIADESPLEPGTYLIPAYATPVPPPETAAHETAVFDGGQWIIRPDYRGEAYYEKTTGKPHTITAIGVLPDPGWTDQPPGDNTIWDEQANAWVPDIEAIKEATWRRLEADMHAYIFVTHDYPQPTQITLQAIYADPDSNAAQRAACKSIFDWVKGTVLAHYYAKKAEILASEAPASVTWDFVAACDGTAPGYSLAQIIQMVG